MGTWTLEMEVLDFLEFSLAGLLGSATFRSILHLHRDGMVLLLLLSVIM